MKARAVPSKQEIRRVEERVWKETLECIVDEGALGLVAAKRFFGMGEKRMAAYIKCLQEVKDEFKVYDKDGIFPDKLREELEAVGIDFDELYTIDQTFEETYKSQRREDRSQQLSMKEAAEVKMKLDAFRSWNENNGIMQI